MSSPYPGYEIIPATALDDTELLRPVLESVVRDPVNGGIVSEDVEDILASVPRSEDEMKRKYTVVAWSPITAKTLGMMSLISPDSVMCSFAQSPSPTELTNAYVLSHVRGFGIGRTLVEHVEKYAGEQGYTEIILNSGPRYRYSGWPFWNRRYGQSVGIARDYYGPGRDAPVWRKPLIDPK